MGVREYLEKSEVRSVEFEEEEEEEDEDLFVFNDTIEDVDKEKEVQHAVKDQGLNNSGRLSRTQSVILKSTVWIGLKIHFPAKSLASRLSSLHTVKASCLRSWSCMSSSRIGGAISCPGPAKSHTKLVRHKCSSTTLVSCSRSLSSMGISSHLVIIAGDIVDAVHCLMVFASPLRGSVMMIPTCM